MAFLTTSKPDVQSQVIAVVGMHRSGTSCLAGSLQQKGLYLGKVHEWNEHNKKGNRENDAIAQLNDSILQHSGGSWFEPPAKLAWTRKHEKQRNAIVRDFEATDVPTWGFKEPRALLTMSFWQEALPKLEFVGTYRHPYLVAQSLEKRDSMPIDYGVNLWESYNRKMLEIYEIKPFAVISFDLNGEEYIAQVNKMAEQLNLPEATNQENFLDPNLKNTLPVVPEGLISESALELFRDLCSLPNTL